MAFCSVKSHRESLSTYLRCHRNQVLPAAQVSLSRSEPYPHRNLCLLPIWNARYAHRHTLFAGREVGRPHTHEKKKKNWLTGALLSIVWKDGDGGPAKLWHPYRQTRSDRILPNPDMVEPRTAVCQEIPAGPNRDFEPCGSSSSAPLSPNTPKLCLRVALGEADCDFEIVIHH